MYFIEFMNIPKFYMDSLFCLFLQFILFSFINIDIEDLFLKYSCAFISFVLQVLKFLMEKNSISALHGQVTIGTLILQVCDWYLLFEQS
jgi:predicted Kef-type K+ transport protein